MNKRQRKKQIKIHKKHIIKQNKLLVKHYPFLLPRNVFSDKVPSNYNYNFTEYDSLLKGWKIGFGEFLLEELREACLKTDYLNRLRIFQWKEKYGSMRLYFNAAPSEVHNIANDYEFISQYICGQCGSIHGHVINDYGWYFPLCKKCYEKNNKRREKRGLHIVPWEKVCKENESELPDAYQVTRFSLEGNKVVMHDISEKVQKIKKKYYKRHKE